VKAFQAISDEYAWIKVNGQLVMHEEYCIHVIECPPDAFAHVITIMNDDMNAGVFRSKAKVLISTDVKAGAFSEYSYRVITAATSTIAEFSSSEGFTDVAVECIQDMVKIGQLSQQGLADDDHARQAGNLTPSG
jgi:hypothetical protein